MPLGDLLRTLTVNNGAILVPHIDAYQASGKFPAEWVIKVRNEKVDDGFYHPSTHALMKTKALWSDRRYPQPQPIGAKMRRVFDAGHLWHGYYGEILTAMGFIDPGNVELHKKIEIATKYGTAIGSGTGDLVGVNIPGQGEWLVDMKTMRKDEFESGPSKETYAKWAAQVNIYGDWFNFDKMMILAIQKDSPHDLREYIIEPDFDLITGIYNRWTYVANCIKLGEEPDPDFEDLTL